MAKKQIKKNSTRNVKKSVNTKIVKKAKTLYKSDNKVLDGVLAGIAEYLNYDPTLVRLLFVLLVLVTGIIPGILVYIILAVVMPKKVY
jgi:phage shock protein C